MAAQYERMRRSKAGSVSGSGLFATQDISGGSLIHCISDPLIAMPDNAHIEDCCSRCLVWAPADSRGKENMLNAYTEIKLSRCKGCTVVRYCGTECQKADWKNGHKQECALYKRLLPRGILPGTVRVIIRLLHLGKFGLSTQEQWNDVDAMEGHEARFKTEGGIAWERICGMSQGAANYAQALHEDEVRKLYCRFFINAFNAVTQTFDPVGNTLDKTISLLNHSCIPNAVLVFDRRAVSIRALSDIPKDGEITISYIDNTNPTWYRQKELLERYFFTCACLACSAPLETPSEDEKYSFTERIRAIDRDARLLNESSDSEAVIDFAIAEFDQAIRLAYTLDKSTPWNQPKPLLHYTMAQAHIQNSQWAKALLHLATLYVTSDAALYKTSYHPVRVCRNFTLAMVLLEVSATSPGSFDLDYTKLLYGILVEVAGNVDKSHGKDSTFAQTVKRKKKEVETDIGIDGGEEAKKWLGNGLGTIPGLKTEVGKFEKIVKAFVKELSSNLSI